MPAKPNKFLPQAYVFIETKEGGYWRLKRGTVKKAVLNKAMKQSSRLLTKASHAGGAIRNALAEFTYDLATGRLGNRVNRLLMQSLKEKKVIDFSYLEGLEFQDAYLFDRLVKTPCFFETDKQKKVFRFGIDISENSVKQFNKLVTGYRFAVILLYADTTDRKNLKIMQQSSPQYSFTPDKERWVAEISFPKKMKQWLFCVRAECFEGKEPSAHPKMRAMKVVSGG